MSSDEKVESASRRLKHAVLRRAFSEGRGTATIADLNRRYLHKQALHAVKDEDILGQFEAAANSLRETRQQILECLSKTDFNREESPAIREMMMQDIAEQELTIDLLRMEGMPEEKLPKISMALARLNAYERQNALLTNSEEPEWYEWSDSNPRIAYNRRRAHEILSKKKLAEYEPQAQEISFDEPADEHGVNGLSEISTENPADKPPKYRLN